jgi:hypothetical protein
MGRWLRNVHDEISLRDRSTELTVGGNVKSRVVCLVLSVIALTLFPRTERCSRVWISASGRRADNDVILLFSRIRLVTDPGSEREIVLS